MKDVDKKIIRDQIAPRLQVGELSLLLGAGFSIENEADKIRLPSGDQLKVRLLQACGKTPGKNTTLKEAYKYANRELNNFDSFFANCFKVDEAFQWQISIFKYVWSRIYTTNVDNVLNAALQVAQVTGKAAGDFRFFNYVDEGLVSETIGSIPVVTMHGTCLSFEDGFVFSSLDYARATNRYLDWHNDLAARILAGGMIVVGNQLEESDFDSYIVRRQETYGAGGDATNWLVGPDVDDIKAENLRSAGFHVVDATAEDFFKELFSVVKPATVAEVLMGKLPAAKRFVRNVASMTWFKGAFTLVFDNIEKAEKQKGIFRHYITGSHPDWFYIVNRAHADTSKGRDLTREIVSLMGSNAIGTGLLHVLGPSGSGKTTAIRNSLIQIVRTYKYVYEFEPEQSLEKDYFKNVLENLTEKSIFVFYSAAEFYFAIKEGADLLHRRTNPYCLFVLEDRTSEYQKNKRQLYLPGVNARYIEFGHLELADAFSIAKKIEEVGLKIDNFSEFPTARQASMILDKEKGYAGDLLTALFSLTTHENFERKIFEDYQSAQGGLKEKVLDIVAIVHSFGHRLPLNYIAGGLQESLEDIVRIVEEDLAGILISPPGTSVASCRHRVIANYYFDRQISGRGDAKIITDFLEFLSRQFTVDDIRMHPLPYRIYTELISFEFLYELYFSKSDRREFCEALYHDAQRFFGSDGIFWLHFGRFYRKVGRLDQAIDCFRTGLTFYDSYQTRHQLGLTLIELYLEDGVLEYFNDGLEILERERLNRGARDSYPIGTLIQLLTKVLQKDPRNSIALAKAKECINFGMKHFRGEEFFDSVAREYLRLKL